MGKALITVFWVMVFAIATFLIFRYTSRSVDAVQEGDSEIVANIQDRKEVYDNIADPKLVVVTYGDSLYHDPSCSWAGSKSRRMSTVKAVELGFHPCSQCIEEDMP